MPLMQPKGPEHPAGKKDTAVGVGVKSTVFAPHSCGSLCESASSTV